MNTGKRLTFYGLFDLVDTIEIPILQRDYAQGRAETADVRSLFLNSLFDALTVSDIDDRQPLDLDFVYGNFEGKENKIFSVLDGQQRLTTLFLLHWYLALKNNRLVDFRSKFLIEKKDEKRISRFTYKTRSSSIEFFDALSCAEFSPTSVPISELISDFRWFFMAWKQDPTVQSCLCMLDAIEEKFGDYDGDLYERLINTSEPFITFQFLNLHSFGLSDELYIKMNARGKPLTSFENFKAWLFGRLDTLTPDIDFAHKVDQQWTDVFWTLSLNEKLPFDDLYLRFFNLLTFFHSCEIITGSYILLEQTDKNWLANIRISKGYIPHSHLEAIKAFEQKDITRISKVLDFFASTDNSQVLNLFKTVLKMSGYLSQIQFYSLILFIEKAPEISEWNELTQTQLSCWLRITQNLINNHRIDELSSFIPSIRALNQLSENCLSIYDSINSDSFETIGFNSVQWEEEILKAQLILKNESWDLLLRKYEEHEYLKGKVGFILDMAKSDNNYRQDMFEAYAYKVAYLLSSEILTSSNFLLQRALLSIDDYLIRDGTNRYSFALPNNTTYRERSENWFDVVVKPSFKTLLDKIIGNENILSELEGIINTASCKGWRGLIVKNPSVIKYCTNRLIYRQGNLVYLLTKSTRRGYHSELRTFVLDKILNSLEEKNLLPSEIKPLNYVEVYGDELPPHLWFESIDGLNIPLSFDHDGFYSLNVLDSNSKIIETKIPEILRGLIFDLLPEENIQ